VQAGVVNRVHATGASGLPLRSQVNEKKFKLLFLDIGLMRTSIGLEPREVLEEGLINLRSGALAEQFVGQEILSYRNLYEEKQLYFWEREKKPSSSEIDYVFNLDGRIIPIEVKAGKTGRLRSLQQFMLEKKCPVGVRISSLPLSYERNILSIPFYMIKHLSKIWSYVLTRD
jgi:predicted AAA+ superfamily ATPase